MEARGDRFKNVMIVHVMDRKMSYYLLFNPFIFFKMKQKLFFIAVAAMGMASCSQDESTGINNGNAIDFRAALGTRAVETTTANLDKIVVTAIDKNDANYFTERGVHEERRFLHLHSRPITGLATAATSRSTLTRRQPRIWALP